MNKAIIAGALSLGALVSTGAVAQDGTAFSTSDNTLTDVDSIRTMSSPLPFGSGLDETRPIFVAGTETSQPGTLGNTTFPAMMDPDTVSGTTTATGATTTTTTTTPIAQTGVPTQTQTTVAPDLTPTDDQSWVAISGTVRFTSEDSFVVDYDEGSVRVQMTNWAWYDDAARAELAGSPVRVYGELNDGVLQEQVVEAQALYVQNLGTYFHASDVDMRTAGFSVETPVEPSTIELKGTVNTVDPTTFTIDMDQQQVTIDVGALENNPLDDQGFQQIQQGDLVIVEAPLFANFFANKWLQATSVVTLHRDESRQNLIGVTAETTGEGTTSTLGEDIGTDETGGTTDGTDGAFDTDTDTEFFGVDTPAEPFEQPESNLP